MLADAVQEADAFDPAAMILDQAARLLEADVSAERLRALLGRLGGVGDKVWPSGGEQGWVAAPLPEAIGGFALGWSLAGDLARLCGRHTASVPLIPGMIAALAFAAAGDEAQATDVTAGARMASLALGTPDSDVSALPL